MLPYIPSFAVLVVSCSIVAYRQHRKESAIQPEDEETELRIKSIDAEASATQFRRIFLPVYLLVMGSDWLQGPYIYTLYKDEKKLDEAVVAALFMTGFISAAVSASFVGSLADKYGRRFACLAFCAIYSVSCLTTLLNDLVILFIGRMLGGIATTLMYSVFESWMVTEYHKRGLNKSSLSLSSMFGLMTTFNSAVAIGAGLLGELAVRFTDTKTSPFMVAVVTLGTAGWLMTKQWNENHGDSASSTPQNPDKSTLAILRQDTRILGLGFISACFEGSMYLFIFFWSAALKSAHSLNPETSGSDLPFGLIFATFMCSMMLGSLLFSIFSSNIKGSLFTNSSMLTLTIGLAGTCLMIPIFVKNETLTLICFCAYELCVGVYYPSMGAQKGKVIDDGVRAQIYGVLRIPLNVFVVAALATTREGDQHRDGVFLFCGGLLLLASVAAAFFLDDGASKGYHQAESSEVWDESSPRK